MTADFAKFLEEAPTMKKLPFRKTIKTMFAELQEREYCSKWEKVNFNAADKERAQFHFGYLFESPELERDPLVFHKTFLKFVDGVNSMLAVLGCETRLLSDELLNCHETKFQLKSKWGYDVEMILTNRTIEQNTIRMFGDIIVTGAPVKEKKVENLPFPNIKEGMIFESTFGVTMDILHFFKLKRRSNNTIYCVEVGKEATEGQLGYYGRAVACPDKEMNVVYRGTIDKQGRVSLKYSHSISLNLYEWDGKSSYFNYID